MTTHPIIDRLADIGSEELTVADVAFVLGRHRALAEKLVRDGVIESHAESVRSGQAKSKLACTPSQRRCRYTIAAAALLVHLLNSTRGDRTVILSAIETRFPQHLPLCKRVAGHAPAPAPAEPSNVIPMHGSKRAKAPKSEHPDQLFLFTA